MTDKTIKSVRRVFEILELFHAEQRPLSANEISRHLGYPLTSAHALLKSIHELNYADYDPSDWSYMPSRKLSGLLDWISDFLEREQQLLDFILALNHATKETVNLSRQRGEQAKIIHGLESLHTVGVSVKVGTVMPLTGSLTGMALLAAMPKDDRLRFLSSEPDPDAAKAIRERFEDVADELARLGTVSRCDQYIRGIGAACIAVRASVSKEIMVIGVVGPSDRIEAQQAEHRKTLARLAGEYGIDCVFPFPR